MTNSCACVSHVIVGEEVLGIDVGSNVGEEVVTLTVGGAVITLVGIKVVTELFDPFNDFALLGAFVEDVLVFDFWDLPSALGSFELDSLLLGSLVDFAFKFRLPSMEITMERHITMMNLTFILEMIVIEL